MYKNLKLSFLFFCVLQLFYSCSNNAEINTDQVSAAENILDKTDSILPPVTVLITNPIKPCLKGCPPPNKILIPTGSTNQAITLLNGEIQKILPPEIKPAALLANMQNYNTSNGLSSDAITASIVDKNGNLWIGSDGGGLSRYDGKTFTNFTTVNGLSNNQIRCITEDKAGNIWLGTNGGGVSCYDGKSFVNYTIAQGLVGDRVYAIIEDAKGFFWFGTSQGLSRFDGKSFTNYTIANGLANNNSILGIIEDKKGNIWFGSYGGGVSRFDGKFFTNFTKANGLAGNVVRCIKEDKKGVLWFGTSNGVSRFDPELIGNFNGKSLTESKLGFTNFTPAQGLVNNKIIKIVEDNGGNLWFATDGGGVSRYDGKSFANFTEAQGLASNSITSIAEDKTGNLWFGTKGSGISRYEGKAVTNFTTTQGLADNIVRGIMEDKNGNLWFGTATGGASCYDGKSFTNFNTFQGLSTSLSVYSVIEDKKGNLWFGTYNGGVSCYDGKSFTYYTTLQGLVHNVVLCIIEDKKGNLWFGTSGGGISCYDGKSFTNYTIAHGVLNNTVLCITEDTKGNIWFGTYKGGVSCYDGKSFINYTTAQGLPSNIITSITQDKLGNLWFSSDDGVARYDGKSFINYTTRDRLPDKFIAQAVITKEEHIALGTYNGLAMLVGFSPVSSQKKDSSTILPAQNSLMNEQLKNYKPIFEIYNPSKGYPLKNFSIGQNAMYKDSKGILWIGTSADKTGLVRFDYTAINKKNELPKVFIQGIKINDENICWNNLNKRNFLQIKNNHSNNYNDSLSLLPVINEEVLTLGRVLTPAERDTMRQKYKDIVFDSVRKFYPVPENLVLPYELNNITFDFAAIEPAKPELIRYQYKLENYDKEWSSATNKTTVTFGNIHEGVYTFKLKAQKIGVNSNGSDIWSEPITYTFKVLPPWWRTWWMYSVYGVLSITFIVFITWWNGRRLRARANELKEEVRLATDTILHQKKIVEEKHKEITDSINYAERIQRALLASKKLLDENLSNYFIFFKPKDVVSGDFYWATKLDNTNFVLVTADSTGHGVPGAIMSILNIACLDKAVTKSIISPDLLLNETRKLVIEYLKNDGSKEGGKDGMDGSLLSFDFKNNKLYCASAFNPIWIIRGVELIEIKADRMPIGKGDKDKIPFTLQTFTLQKGDMVYTLTDGFADQFGGASGKKFKYKQLQLLLLLIAHEQLEIQKQKLDEAFENWKGDFEQVDDVCLIGIRV